MPAEAYKRFLFRRLPGKASLILLLGLAGCLLGKPFSLFEAKPQQLPWVEAKLGNRSLKIMVARTVEQQRIGLMFRRELAENEGLLFVYPFPQVVAFWMKNTPLPLDVILFSPKLEVSEFLLDLQPGVGISDVNLPAYMSQGKVQYALEVPAGSVMKWELKLGERLRY